MVWPFSKMAIVPIPLFEQWLTAKGLKPRSIQNYFYYFNRFQDKRFNQATVSRFLADPSHRNTIARAFIKNLKECMLRNHQELGLDTQYHQEISDVYFPGMTGRKQQRLVDPLSEEEIFQIEQALDGEHLKLMHLVTYYGGLRLGEMTKLRLNSFNWTTWKQTPEKMGEVRVFGKGDKEGIAILPAHLMKRIANFINANSIRYKGIDSKLFQLGASSFQKHLNKAGLKTGITKIKEDGSIQEETRVHPHRLRHSRAHHLLLKGMDIRYIKDVLRHSSIQSTQIYTKLSTQEIKDKLQALT